MVPPKSGAAWGRRDVAEKLKVDGVVGSVVDA